jgi:adenylate cyclase class 2
MPASHRETEIKLRVASAAEGRGRLKSAGFVPATRQLFETNTVLDTPGRTLRRCGALLRVRKVNRRGILTYKGPRTKGKHKSREELEVEVGDLQIVNLVLARLGFEPVFRYEKFRTEFRPRNGVGLATLDETPVGVFLELEGSPRWIDRTARALGFSEADYITSSYSTLYLDYCRANCIPPTHMVFNRRS